MAARWARAAARGGVAGAVAAGPLLFAAPAHACSCGTPDPDQAVAEGRAVALVTRTDEGTDDARAVLRVERSVGPQVPAEVSPHPDPTCQNPLAPHQVATLVLRRLEARGTDVDGRWVPAECGDVPLGAALEKLYGKPVRAKGGPPVAVAVGAFGGSRLAALDAAGRTVAWDGLPGEGGRAALCPGGKALAALGYTGLWEDQDRAAQLTVHDPTDLAVRRTVALPAEDRSYVHALRCADREGRRIQFLADAGEEVGGARLVTVDGGRVTSTDPGPVHAAAATPEGFVALAGPHDSGATDLVAIAGDGTVRPLGPAREPGSGSGLTSSPDGRTLAYVSYRDEAYRLVTADGRTGRRLGRFGLADGFPDLTFTADGRILARLSTRLGGPAGVWLLDRDLAKLSERPGAWPWRIAAVGDGMVAYRGARLTLLPAGARPRELQDPRLAAATDVLALPGGRLDAQPAGPGPAAGSGTSVLDGVLGILAVVVALGMGWFAVARRRVPPTGSSESSASVGPGRHTPAP